MTSPACCVQMLRPWISLLLLLATRGAHATGDSGEAAIRGFVDAVHNGAADQMAFVLDVGANNGAWSQSIMGRVPQASEASKQRRRRGAGVRVQPILFEPQQVFRKPLQRLANGWGGIFYPAAAWTNATNLTFYLSNFNQASSLSESMALTFNDPKVNPTVRRVTVPTVDLSAVLRRCVRRANGGPIFLKLDTESAEYDLLPRLLTSGALCDCTFLLIEWHLNAMSPARRLQGVLLRNALDGLLARGCAAPPRLIIHDEDFLNNFGEAVPGLGGLAARHKKSESLRKKRPYATAASLIATRP